MSGQVTPIGLLLPRTSLNTCALALGIPRHQVKGKLALDVGIGIGGIADSLSRAEDCEIIGMDLGYAVDSAHRYFGKNMRLHIVQASLFAPPFAANTFDVVYSQGVIHHTFSTREAFRSIASLPKSDGMLYVWAYSHEDEQASVLRRILMTIERSTRPLLSRLPSRVQAVLLLPALPFYMVYQNCFRRRDMGEQLTPKYRWNEALHAARDRLTPPFAHRHSYEEVANWFRAAGYHDLEMLRDQVLPRNIPPTVQQCVGIRGFFGQASASHLDLQED
jgi:SAM-dependent methyltransferase